MMKPTTPVPEVISSDLTTFGPELASLCTISRTGVEIPTDLSPEQIQALGSRVGEHQAFSDWLLGDFATALMVRAGEHPNDAAKRLGVDVAVLIEAATTSQHWPQAEREPGVPSFVHAEVYRELIFPVGTKLSKEKGIEVLRQWKSEVVGPANLRRTLASLQKECREAMQPKLLEVEQAKPTREAKPQADGLAGWQTVFVRQANGEMLLITVGGNGEPSTLRKIDSLAFANFLEQFPIDASAKTWEELARRVLVTEDAAKAKAGTS
jgi:hypothetical protein